MRGMSCRVPLGFQGCLPGTVSLLGPSIVPQEDHVPEVLRTLRIQSFGYAIPLNLENKDSRKTTQDILCAFHARCVVAIETGD